MTLKGGISFLISNEPWSLSAEIAYIFLCVYVPLHDPSRLVAFLVSFLTSSRSLWRSHKRHTFLLLERNSYITKLLNSYYLDVVNAYRILPLLNVPPFPAS